MNELEKIQLKFKIRTNYKLSDEFEFEDYVFISEHTELFKPYYCEDVGMGGAIPLKRIEFNLIKNKCEIYKRQIDFKILSEFKYLKSKELNKYKDKVYFKPYRFFENNSMECLVFNKYELRLLLLGLYFKYPLRTFERFKMKITKEGIINLAPNSYSNEFELYYLRVNEFVPFLIEFGNKIKNLIKKNDEYSKYVEGIKNAL